MFGRLSSVGRRSAVGIGGSSAAKRNERQVTRVRTQRVQMVRGINRRWFWWEEMRNLDDEETTILDATQWACHASAACFVADLPGSPATVRHRVPSKKRKKEAHKATKKATKSHRVSRFLRSARIAGC